MSIEAQPHQDIQETGSPVNYSLVERLDEETRAKLQAVIDTPASKSILYPPEMQDLMKVLPTNDQGERTRAGEVIAIRKYANAQLNGGAESTLDVAEADKLVTKTRRVVRAAGSSPYASGDGMISISHEPAEIERGGTVTSAVGSNGKSRRAHRAEASLPVADLLPLDYEERTYSNGVKHFYASGEDGKKRHVSAASILSKYGHAGDFQGKRPVVAEELEQDLVQE